MKHKKIIIFAAVIAFLSFIVLDFTKVLRKQDFDEEYTSDQSIAFTEDKPGVERVLTVCTWKKDKNENLTYVEMKLNEAVNTGFKHDGNGRIDYEWMTSSGYIHDVNITAQFDGNIEIHYSSKYKDKGITGIYATQMFTGKIKNHNSKDESQKRYYLDSDIVRTDFASGSNSITVAWVAAMNTDNPIYSDIAYYDESDRNIYEYACRYQDIDYIYITAYDPLYEDVVRASATVEFVYTSWYHHLPPEDDPLGLGEIRETWTAALIDYYELPPSTW